MGRYPAKVAHFSVTMRVGWIDGEGQQTCPMKTRDLQVLPV